MPTITTSLRPAEPTIEDGLVFAYLLDQAQGHMYRMMLGPRAHHIVAEAFTRPDHDLSFEHVTFAEYDGAIVGMASGYAAKTQRRFTYEPLREAAGRRRRRMDLFMRMDRRAFEFIDTIPEGEYYLRAYAVYPDHRGKGIGTLLFHTMEDAARAAGAVRLALDVASTNRKAQRLYERLGLTRESESPRWFGLPNTNLIRMVEVL